MADAVELKQGMRGPVITELQQVLTALGAEPGPIDGLFGPLTEEALRRFQQHAQLDASGRVDAPTRLALGKAHLALKAQAGRATSTAGEGSWTAVLLGTGAVALVVAAIALLRGKKTPAFSEFEESPEVFEGKVVASSESDALEDAPALALAPSWKKSDAKAARQKKPRVRRASQGATI